MRVESHRQLLVWQKAIELVVDCYRLSRAFPKHEVFGLGSQLQRAAVSVAANIAEGKGRGTRAQFLAFPQIESGSLTEVDTHLVIARRLNYLSESDYLATAARVEEVGRMLTGLRRSLERS